MAHGGVDYPQIVFRKITQHASFLRCFH